jgi:hypothetical protein
MNTLIFADVHGDAKALLALLSRTRGIIGPDAPLTVYSVGDLIDRGADSKRVIDICIKHGVRNLLGNHELWLHEWVTTGKVNGAIPLSSAMGGEATLRSYGINPDKVFNNRFLASELDRVVPQEHREYIANGELWADVAHGDTTYFLSHGGISQESGNAIWNDPEVVSIKSRIPYSNRELDLYMARMLFDSLFKAAPQQILWVGAKKNKVFRLPDGCVQVFGHTPWRGGAEIADHYVALDTGCGTCLPFRLSGLLLREDGGREIVSSNSKSIQTFSV